MFSGAAGRIYTIESPGLRGSRLEWFEQWLNQDTYSRGGQFNGGTRHSCLRGLGDGLRGGQGQASW